MNKLKLRDIIDNSTNNFPVCNGKKVDAIVTFTVDDGKSLVVVRNTPATVCSLCGEEWISDRIAESLEAMVSEAKAKHRTLEVIDFSLEDVA